MENSFISIKNLSKDCYQPNQTNFYSKNQKTKIINNFNLFSTKPEIIGIFGPKNSGKTTLFKILLGFSSPSSGEVKILGMNPECKQEKYLSQIGFVNGQKHNEATLPVNASLELYSYLYGISREDFAERKKSLIKNFRFQNLLKVQINHLTNVERIQFELIANLLHQPKLIMLDGILSELNLTALETVKRILKEYHHKCGCGILIFSHDLDILKNFCDRIVNI